MPRTRIAVITVEPQGFTQHLILKGVIQQCHKYGYDTAVYAQNVKVIHKNPEDLEGERSIYDLICFEAFQGVIVDALSFYDTNAMETYAFLAKLLRERCRCPVITLRKAIRCCLRIPALPSNAPRSISSRGMTAAGSCV